MRKISNFLLSLLLIPSLVFAAGSTTTQPSANVLKAEIASTASGKGAAMVGFKASAAGSLARTVHQKNSEILSAKDFAVGDGVADDTAAMSNFFTACSVGKTCLIPAGTYKLTSLLVLPTMRGSKFIGAPGQTKITGSFGYSLVQMGELIDVEFYGITFESTYSNAELSSNTAVVFMTDVIWRDVKFYHCKFTTPNANTQALVAYSRTVAGATAGFIDGLWIENSTFDQVGCTAITLMNRGTGADKYQAARRVYIRNNYARGLGLKNSYGMFVSLDGYGSEFDISGNSIEDGYLTLIENTGWWNGSIKDNRFSASVGYAKKWRAMSIDGGGWVGGVKNVTVADNKILGNAPVGSYVWACSYCEFKGNVWTFTEAGHGFDEAFAVYDTDHSTFSGETYLSDDKYALRVMSDTGASQYNKFINITASTAASAANTAVVNFNGAATQYNEVRGVLVKGAAGAIWTQTTSAANNAASDESKPTHGIYTPTLDNTLNISASTSYPATWSRNGDSVTVSGRVDVDPTTTGSTYLGISLPVASNFSASTDGAGMAATNEMSTDRPSAIFADPTNDVMTMRWNTSDAANHAMFYSYTYKVR